MGALLLGSTLIVTRALLRRIGLPFLQVIRRGRLISADIAAEVRRIAGEHVVGEEVAGQPLQGIQAAHQIGLDPVARAFQLSGFDGCARIFSNSWLMTFPARPVCGLQGT